VAPWPAPPTDPSHVPFPAVDPHERTAATAGRTPARVAATPFRPTTDGLPDADGDRGTSGSVDAAGPWPTAPATEGGPLRLPPEDLRAIPTGGLHAPGGDPASSTAGTGVDHDPGVHEEAGLRGGGVDAPGPRRRTTGDGPTVLRTTSQLLALAVIAPVAGSLLGIFLAVVATGLAGVGVATAAVPAAHPHAHRAR
jgi:hypothetical protein